MIPVIRFKQEQTGNGSISFDSSNVTIKKSHMNHVAVHRKQSGSLKTIIGEVFLSLNLLIGRGISIV